MFADGNRLKDNHLMHYWWPMSAVNIIVLLMDTMMVGMTDIDDLFDTLQYYILCCAVHHYIIPTSIECLRGSPLIHHVTAPRMLKLSEAF